MSTEQDEVEKNCKCNTETTKCDDETCRNCKSTTCQRKSEVAPDESCSPDKCATCPKAADCNSQMKNQAAQDGCTPSKCKGCPNAGKCGKVNAGPTPEQIEIGKRFANIKKIIIVLSGKGGVGKSTVSTQLSYWLAEVLEKRVGLVDLDICGPSIPTLTSTKGSEVHQCAQGWETISVTERLSVMSIGFMLQNEDDAVIMRGPRKHSMVVNFLRDVYWGDLDYLVIDTPPGTSDEHLSIINLLFGSLSDRKSDVSAVIVTTPQEVALADVRKEIHFCNSMKLRVVGVVENMSGFVCPCCNKETLIFNPTTGGAKKMCGDMEVPYLGNIPLDPLLQGASEKGIPWSMAIEMQDNAEIALPAVEQSVGLERFSNIVDSIVTNVNANEEPVKEANKQ